MTTISQDQALKRWDSLPDVLKTALYSDINADFLWKAAEAEHLPKEKIRAISKIVGYVLLGFIHPEDMAQELKDVGVVGPVAESIASSVNGRVFAPIREDLDKIYEPPSKFGESPKFVEEIKRPATAPVPEKIGGGPIDLSKIFGATPSAPKAPQTPSSAPKPADKPLSEFERLGLAATSSAGAPPAAPTMLHKETETKPGEKVSGFKLEVPIPKFGGGKPFEPPQGKPAILEFGLDKKSGSPTPPSAPRVVNYSGLRTPLPPVPPPKNPERELKEVTKEIKPPSSPLSSKPPLPEIKIPAAPIPAIKPQNVFSGTGTKPIVPESRPPFLRFDMLQNKSNNVVPPPLPVKPPLSAAAPSIFKAEPPQPIGIKPIIPGNKPSLLGDEKMMHPSTGSGQVPSAGPSISGPGTRNFGQIPSPAPRPISPPAPIAPPRERIEPPPVRKPEPPI